MSNFNITNAELLLRIDNTELLTGLEVELTDRLRTSLDEVCLLEAEALGLTRQLLAQ